MNIASILDSGANVQIVVTAADLKEFALALAKELKQQPKPQQDEQCDRLLTAAEVAAMLGVSKITLHRWEKDGYLKPVRIGGGLVRYKEKDVQQIARQA